MIGTGRLSFCRRSVGVSGRSPDCGRPLGYAGRTIKWVRRHKLVSGLLLLTIISMVAGTVLSILFALESRQFAGETLKAKEKVEQAKTVTDTLLARTNELFNETQQQLYRVSLVAATKEWEAGSPAMARTNLAECPAELRNWEYYALERLFSSKCNSSR